MTDDDGAITSTYFGFGLAAPGSTAAEFHAAASGLSATGRTTELYRNVREAVRLLGKSDASRRVLERNGWTYDLPRPTRSCGEERDQWHLSLDRRAWASLAEPVRPERADVRLAAAEATAE